MAPQAAKQRDLAPTLTASVEVITPELARQWLGSRKPNRAISRPRVVQYARDIKEGRWGLTGETIIFDWDGRLIDGQQRLSAIIEADTPIKSLVVRGVDPAEFIRIDSGKTRTMADTLGIKGVTAPATLAGALRLLYLYNRGALGMPFQPRVSRDEQFVELNAWPTIQDSLQARTWCRKVLSPSATVFFHFVFARIDGELANYFFTKLGGGEDLSREHDSAIYWLRERLLGEKREMKRMFLPELHALIIKAWNATLRGQAVKRLTWSPTESFPTIAER